MFSCPNSTELYKLWILGGGLIGTWFWHCIKYRKFWLARFCLRANSSVEINICWIDLTFKGHARMVFVFRKKHCRTTKCRRRKRAKMLKLKPKLTIAMWCGPTQLQKIQLTYKSRNTVCMNLINVCRGFSFLWTSLFRLLSSTVV